MLELQHIVPVGIFQRAVLWLNNDQQPIIKVKWSFAESEREQKCRDVPASLLGSIQAQGDDNADDITNH